MSLRFSALGDLRATLDGEPIALGSPKQRAVLALLLMCPNRPLSSDQLIDGLWGENAPDSAQATLQAYISNLRKALEPDRPARAPARVIEKNGGGYQISLDRDSFDVTEFEALIEEAQTAPDRKAVDLVDSALALWRGQPYADFRYDEFAQQEVGRLEDLRLTGIERRIESLIQGGESAELIGDLERLVNQHPLRENLWGHLMLALYRSGRQAEALRAYRRCESHLADELGIVPGEALRKLELAILEQSPDLDRPAAKTSQTELVEITVDLVGREYEKGRVLEGIKRARAGQGSVILIEGEAGIGKTRLLESLESAARSLGFQTAFARCVEVGGSPAFWPWIQLARHLGVEPLSDSADEYAPYLAPLLPDQHGSSVPGPPLFRTAESLAMALRRLATDRPLFLVIDDLYSADPDSLSLLTLFAAEIADVPLVLIGSHRGSGLAEGHPLTDTLTQLMRLSWVERIAMRRLDHSEVGELVRGLVSCTVSDEAVDAINGRTEGNAFFTVELTRLMESEDCLDAEMARTAVPSTVMEVMSRRLSGFADESLRLVRTAAVYGREFDIAIVADALEFGLDESIESLEEAIHHGIVTETERPGIYRFSHMIAVNGVTQSLGAIRRAHIHWHIAEAMEARVGTDPSRWVEIAHHWEQAIVAAGATPAIEALARAGGQALRSTALEQAERLFLNRHALVMAEPAGPRRDELEVGALFDLARIWTWREGYQSARLAEAADRLWQLIGFDQGRARFDEGQPITADDPILSTFQARFSYEIVSGNITAANEVVDRYLALSDSHPDPMVTFSANLASLVASVHAPNIEKALEAGKRAAKALEVLDPDHTGQVGLPLNQQSGRVTFHVFNGWATWLAGQKEKSRAEFGEARRISEALDHPFNRAFTVCVEGLAGAMDRSPEWVADSVRWGRAGKALDEFDLVATWIRLLDVWSSGMLGADPGAAAEEFVEILAYTEKAGAMVVHTLYMGMLAELRFKAGQPKLALEAVKHGIELTESGERFWYPELERLGATAYKALGDASASSEALARAELAARELSLPPIIERLMPQAATG